MGNIPPVTLFLLIANVGLSIAAFYDQNLFARLSYDPYLVKHRNQWWRIFTGAFIHADWIHLIFNMWALYSFGSFAEWGVYPWLFSGAYADDPQAQLEKGRLLFVGLYFGGLLASKVKTYFKHSDDPYYSAVGASGAVSAAIMPYVLFAPTEKLLFFFIPMPSVLFALVYLGMSWYLARREDQRIGHDAHFWGAVFGIAFTLVASRIIGEPSILDRFFGELGIYL